jgi:hypothetical protein
MAAGVAGAPGVIKIAVLVGSAVATASLVGSTVGRAVLVDTAAWVDWQAARTRPSRTTAVIRDRPDFLLLFSTRLS